MNLILKQICMVSTILLTPLSMVATHYINHTGKSIKVTNVASTKRHKKSYFNSFFKKNYQEQSQAPAAIYFIELENDQEGDLDNNQGDEIRITSPGMSDQRKLFPTNNSFNYVVTMNDYNKKYEQFDINHAGIEQVTKKVKKNKAVKKHKKNKNVEQ